MNSMGGSAGDGRGGSRLDMETTSKTGRAGLTGMAGAGDMAGEATASPDTGPAEMSVEGMASETGTAAEPATDAEAPVKPEPETKPVEPNSKWSSISALSEVGTRGLEFGEGTVDGDLNRVCRQPYTLGLLPIPSSTAELGVEGAAVEVWAGDATGVGGRELRSPDMSNASAFSSIRLSASISVEDTAGQPGPNSWCTRGVDGIGPEICPVAAISSVSSTSIWSSSSIATELSVVL